MLQSLRQVGLVLTGLNCYRNCRSYFFDLSWEVSTALTLSVKDIVKLVNDKNIIRAWAE